VSRIMTGAFGVLIVLAGGSANLRGDAAGRQALLTDPRYQQIAELDRQVREWQRNPAIRIGGMDGLYIAGQRGRMERVLRDSLKSEAEACGHCQPAQGKYEELQKLMNEELNAALGIASDAGGGPGWAWLLKALQTGDWNSPPPLTDEQLEPFEVQRILRRVEQHCVTVYSPQFRLELLAPTVKRDIERNPQKYYAFTKEWNDRLFACEAKLDGKQLYAQHRLALDRCLAAHDADKVQHAIGTTASQIHAEEAAFNRCMNETDAATAACTEGAFVAYWINLRHDPNVNTGPIAPCAPVTVPLTRLRVDLRRERQLLTLEHVRAYAADPAKMAELEKQSAGITPASLEIRTSLAPPVAPFPAFGTPVNSLGVPVGAKFAIALLEPIDLLHVDAARRYPAQMLGPANFRGRVSLSKGVGVLVRAYRQDTTNPRIIMIGIESVSAVIDSRPYPLPGLLESPELQTINAGGGVTAGDKQTVLPAGATLEGTVLSTLRPRLDDPADANSPLLHAAPFPTEDPAFLNAERGPETSGGAPRPKYSLLPGGLSPPTSLPLHVVVADPVDLTTDDNSLRFRAQTAAAVQYQGETVLPAGTDVFLKVSRKGQNALFYQVTLTVVSALIGGKEIPLQTSQLPRNARIPRQGTVARAATARQQRLPFGVDTLPPGTRLQFSILAPGRQ